MVKYRLSRNSNLSIAADETIPPEFQHGHYILNNNKSHKNYLINETIKFFIEQFAEAKTKETVISEIARQVSTDESIIAPGCLQFIDFLIEREILVKENSSKDIPLAEPFFATGEMIGEWKITGLITSKRYIDVYRVTNIRTAVDGVVKLLNPNKAPEPEIFEKQNAEMGHEYNLLHRAFSIEAVNKVYEFNPEQPCLVLEYIEGKSIARFVKANASLTKAECLNMIRQVLSVFSCLHKINIIHGDIHSSNFIITSDKIVRVIDLGLARHILADENEVLTFGGIHYYMPPERIIAGNVKKYKDPPDLYSDVYQVGVVIYQLLYRDLPFKGFIWKELAKKIQDGEIEYPNNSGYAFEIPYEILDIVKKCLSTCPQRRYLSATEILNDFDRVIKKLA